MKKTNLSIALLLTIFSVSSINIEFHSSLYFETNFLPNDAAGGSYTNKTFSTYLGGSESDYVRGIVIDNSGACYVAGVTYSSNFPLKNEQYNKWVALSFYSQGFLTKFNPDGSLNFSTFTGAYDSQCEAIGIDKHNNIYITGKFEKYSSTERDVYVSKFDSEGNQIYYKEMWGTENDIVTDLVVDAEGYCYVIGATESVDFPTLNAYDSTHNGGYETNTNVGVHDIFFFKLNPDGILNFSTFLGGEHDDEGRGITLDSDGNCYIVGKTSSPNFPIIDAYDSDLNGSADAVISKFSNNGTLIYSSFFGGSEEDWAYDIRVDIDKNYFITGTMLSYDFPMNESDYLNHTTSYFTKFNQNNSPIYTNLMISPFSDLITYNNELSWDSNIIPIIIGDCTLDFYQLDLTNGEIQKCFCYENQSIICEDGNVITLSDYIYICGRTLSSDFCTINAFDSRFNGNWDIFVVKRYAFGEIGDSSEIMWGFWGGLSGGLVVVLITGVILIVKKRNRDKLVKL